MLYTTTSSVRGTVTQVRRDVSSCPVGSYTWLAVKLATTGATVWAAEETGLVIGDGGGGNEVNYPVPYVHQLWDTGDVFDGRYACGPTSAVMAAAYFGKLPKRPIWNSSPYGHNNDYGFYVSSTYTSPHTGFTFSQTMPDPSGRPAAGAYGACTDGNLAWAWRIQDYLTRNGLKEAFYPSSDYHSVRTALANGRLVILSTEIGGGHLIVVRGYDDATGRFIVNDPWGDLNSPGYGSHINGANVRYTMGQMQIKWRVEVWV